MNKENECFEEQFYHTIKEHNINIIPQEDIIYNKKEEYLNQTNSFSEGYICKYKNEKAELLVYFTADFKSLLDQVVIVSKLKHENIPKFYGIVNDSKELKLIFEYVPGIRLVDLKYDALTEDNKMKIIKDIATAIGYINKMNFIHRNIKLETVLFDFKANKAYLTDFCISKIIDDGVSTQTRVKGNINFVAPEVFDSEYFDDDGNFISFVSHKADVWSFGCLVSWIYSSHLPWTNKYTNSELIIQQCLSNRKEFPIPKEITDKKIRALIKITTKVDKNERYDIEEVISYLSKI